MELISAVRRSALCFVASVFLTGAPALAQGSDASIVGRVVDESGAILPGVTVTAKGAALQVGEVSVVTNAQGDYRLSPLPIGTYNVEYSLVGFQTVRHSAVRLTAGFVARMNEVLKVGTLTEAVTVSGASPVVDVQSSGNKTTMTHETLELLPVARLGISAILAQAPGTRTVLDVGGSTGAITNPSYRAFGQSGFPWPTIEGVPTPTLQPGGGNASWSDFGAIEEATVQTVGNAPEFPTRGVQVQIIVKSGSDAFHGSALWVQNNPNWQSNNITDELKAQGVRGGNKLLSRFDRAGDVGGPAIRQRLWFYGALRRAKNKTEALGADTPPDGSTPFNLETGWFITQKETFQLNPQNKFIGFFQSVDKDAPTGGSALVARESAGHFSSLPRTYKGEWQYARGGLLLGAQYGEWKYTSTANAHSDDPATLDIATQRVTGQWVSGGQDSVSHRQNPKVNAVWFKTDFLGGNHEFKSGFDFMRYYESRVQTNKTSGNYQLQFNNSAPFQIAVWNFPTVPQAVIHYYAGHFRDVWTIGPRITLNLGVRYTRDNGYVPASCREAAEFAEKACFDKVQMKIWNNLAPRLFAAYDPGGDGKTVVRGGWARYYAMRQANPDVVSVDPQSQTTTTYRWNDLNGDRRYQSGETDLAPNGPDFRSVSGGTVGVVNPNMEPAKTDELSVIVERELFKTMAVRATGIYAKNSNNYRNSYISRPYEAFSIPITKGIPGEDGVVPAGNPLGTITYYEYPRTLAGRAFEQVMFVNDSAADQTYKSFELAAFRRFSQGWQMSASYNATKMEVPLLASLNPGEFGTVVLAADDTPNGEINSTEKSWEWMGKLQGAYTFPFDLVASASYEIRSGVTWARQALFTGGQTIPSIVLRVESPGSRRLPNPQLVAMRIEKRFRFLGNQVAAVRLNFYNLLNTNAVTSVNMRSGRTFGLPLAIVPPRIAEFGITYSF